MSVAGTRSPAATDLDRRADRLGHVPDGLKGSDLRPEEAAAGEADGEQRRNRRGRVNRSGPPVHSHSIVAGGLELMS